NRYRDHSLRLTWQATSKDKISVGFTGESTCTCPVSTSTAFAPEATGNAVYDPNFVAVASWTRPVTNRLLVEGGSSLNEVILSYGRPPEGPLPNNISIADTGLAPPSVPLAGTSPGHLDNLRC